MTLQLPLTFGPLAGLDIGSKVYVVNATGSQVHTMHLARVVKVTPKRRWVVVDTGGALNFHAATGDEVGRSSGSPWNRNRWFIVLDGSPAASAWAARLRNSVAVGKLGALQHRLSKLLAAERSVSAVLDWAGVREIAANLTDLCERYAPKEATDAT